MMTALGLAWSEGRARKRRTPRESVVVKLARWAGRTLPRWKKFRSMVMQTTAFGSIDFALFHWGLIPGFISIGISLLVLEALGGEK